MCPYVKSGWPSHYRHVVWHFLENVKALPFTDVRITRCWPRIHYLLLEPVFLFSLCQHVFVYVHFCALFSWCFLSVAQYSSKCLSWTLSHSPLCRLRKIRNIEGLDSVCMTVKLLCITYTFFKQDTSIFGCIYGNITVPILSISGYNVLQKYDSMIEVSWKCI